VDHLDLEVSEGEIFGLLGPNGAGKTTTVGMLTTRVVPTSGSVRVAGVDVVAEPARVKQAIGVVSQSNTLDRSLGVRENLSEAFRAALVPQFPHMALPAVYAGMVVFTVGLTVVGVRGFRRRVLS